MRRGNRTTGRQPITRSQSVPNLRPLASNQAQPQQQMQQQMMPDNQNFAEKLMANAPQYLIQRIFANINTIHDLVMGGGWHEPQFKMLLKNEIQELTKNLKHPSLQKTIDELTDAANVPLTLFLNKITDIIQKHINDITYKLSSMAVNLVGEIPGVNIVSNGILAASNAVHVFKNVTEMGEDLFQNIQTFKNDMTAVVNKFNPSINTQLGQQMMQPLGQQPLGQQMIQRGGSNAHVAHNMKDAKKHLHHLHRKKNRTLRRIHHSIHQFLTSNRNTRSIKAKAKH